MLFGCADLEEEIFDEVVVDDIDALLANPSPEFLDNLVSSVYAGLFGIYSSQDYIRFQETPSDISMTPTRFWEDPSRSDWFDGGGFVRLHTHTWTAAEGSVNSIWNQFQGGIAAGLEVLTPFSTPASLNNDLITPRRAEVQGLLAFYMWGIFDLFGQVPYVDISTGANQVLAGDDAINEMIRLLEDALPNLAEKGSSNSGAVFSKGAAQALLARIYLNKAVYANRYSSDFAWDGGDLNQVISFTTDLINTGGYSLTNDYFSMFDADSENNAGTDELIFVVNCEAGQTCNRSLTAMVMSQGQYGGDAGSFRGWNGWCTIPEFVDSWDIDDPRYYRENYPNEAGTLNPSLYQLNRGIQLGVQYGPVPVDANDVPSEGGSFRRDGNGDLVIQELVNFLRDDNTVDYTREVTLQTNQWAGARMFKYEYDTPGPGRWDTDINPVIFRLADAYLMRAEAYHRNGNAGEALNDVNTVRAARGAAPLASIDLDGMLAERAFEFYMESHRRTDLIRFGKFNDAWTDKPASDPIRRVYPIPVNALASSSLLVQNNGY